MNLRKLLSLATVACAVTLLGAEVALAQGPAVDWWVIAGGGAPSSGTGVTLNDTVGQPIIGTASRGGDVALNAGYWVNCSAAAAVMPVVTVARDGNDVLLSWDVNPANAQYQVWVSTDPYFDPDAAPPTTVTADAFYRDIGAAASLVNHFYIVRGLNACGAASASSARKGEFTFGLTPGS